MGDGAYVNAVAVDSSGSAYLTGSAGSPLPVTPGAFQTNYNPASCTISNGMVTINCPMAFAAKLSPDGTSLVYLTYLGMQNGSALGISVDALGDAWITGGTATADLAVTPGAIQSTGPGQFLVKLNPGGTQLLYASYFGATVQSQALDAAGNLYVAGYAGLTGFAATAGAFQTDPGTPRTTPGSFAVGFASKISPAGKLVYSTYFHGPTTGVTLVTSIAADSAGNAYIAGDTTDSALPVITGAFQTTSDGRSGFVAKFDPTGSKLLYCTYLTANTPSGVAAIAVDSQGDAYVTGVLSPKLDQQVTTFPVTAGAFQTTAPSYPIQSNPGFGFVTKLNTAGSALVYSTLLYSSQQVRPYALTVDSAGSAIVAGFTIASDFPTTPGSLLQCSPGGSPSFLFKLSADGSQAAYSTYFGSEQISTIAVDSAGAIYFWGSGLPIIPGSFGSTD